MGRGACVFFNDLLSEIGRETMPNGPLNDLFQAVRAISPTEATNAIFELMRAGDVSYLEAMEAKRALTALREFVDRWDSAAHSPN
jgi:hypothetical protein